MSYDPKDDLFFVAKEMSEKTGIEVNELLKIAKEKHFINESYFEGINLLQGGMPQGNDPRKENTRSYFRSCYEVFLLFGGSYFLIFVVLYYISQATFEGFFYLEGHRFLETRVSSGWYNIITDVIEWIGSRPIILQNLQQDIVAEFFNNLNFNLGVGGFFLLCASIHWYFVPNFRIMNAWNGLSDSSNENAIVVLQQAMNNLPPGSTLAEQRYRQAINQLQGNLPRQRSPSVNRRRTVAPLVNLNISSPNLIVVDQTIAQQTLQNMNPPPAQRGRRRPSQAQLALPNTAQQPPNPNNENDNSPGCCIQGGQTGMLTENEFALLRECFAEVGNTIFNFVGYNEGLDTFDLATIDIQQLEGGKDNLEGGITAQRLASLLFFILLNLFYQISIVFISSPQEVTREDLTRILSSRLFQVGTTNATLRYSSLSNSFEIVTPSGTEALSILYDSQLIQELYRAIESGQVLDLEDFFLNSLTLNANNSLRDFIQSVGVRQGISFQLIKASEFKEDTEYTVIKALEGNQNLQILMRKADIPSSAIPQIISSLVNVSIVDGAAEQAVIQTLEQVRDVIPRLSIQYAENPIDLQFVTAIVDRFKAEVDVNFKFSDIINPQTGLPITELSILTNQRTSVKSFIYAPFGILRIDENILNVFSNLTFQKSPPSLINTLTNKITTSLIPYKVKERGRIETLENKKLLRFAAQKVNSFLSAAAATGTTYYLNSNVVAAAAAGYAAYEGQEVYNAFSNFLQEYGLTVRGLLTPVGFTYLLRYYLSKSEFYNRLDYRKNWKFFIFLGFLATYAQYAIVLEIPQLRSYLQTAEGIQFREQLSNLSMTNLTIPSIDFSRISLEFGPRETTSFLTLQNMNTDMVTPSTDLVTASTDLVTASTDLVTASTDLVTASTDLVTASTDLVTASTELATTENVLDIFTDNSLITYNSTTEEFQVQIPELEGLSYLGTALEPRYSFRQFSINDLSKYLYESYNIQQLADLIQRINSKILANKQLQQTLSNVSSEFALLKSNMNFLEKVLEAAVTAYSRKRSALNIPLEIAAPTITPSISNLPTVTTTTIPSATAFPTTETILFTEPTPSPTEESYEQFYKRKMEELRKLKKKDESNSNCTIM